MQGPILVASATMYYLGTRVTVRVVEESTSSADAVEFRALACWLVNSVVCLRSAINPSCELHIFLFNCLGVCE